MDELVTQTTNGEVRLALSWLSDALGSTGADATWGALHISVRGKPLWYGEDEHSGFEWTWIELLEFLADSWLYLLLEDGPPLGVALDTAPRMLAAAEAAADRESPLGSEIERDQVEAYRITHDVAECLRGVHAPPLWIVRDGHFAWVASSNLVSRAPFEEIVHILVKTGDFISARLRSQADNRSIQAVRSWDSREQGSRQDYIEAATGYPRELVADVESVFFAENERDWTEPSSDVLLAAARQVGPQPITNLRPILEAIRKVGKVSTSNLDEMSAEALAVITEIVDEPPYVHGYELAGWVRSHSAIARSGQRVDPEVILDTWSVPVIDVELGLADIDAIGCWGPDCGPAVLLNSASPHPKSISRRRATLAHEICHLLIDRQTSLPLVEVLGGRTAEHAEKRARAFAAELLLPRELAANTFLSFDGDDERAIRSMRARFQVSSEVIAWQVRNSGAQLSPGSRNFLSKLVSSPSRFG